MALSILYLISKYTAVAADWKAENRYKEMYCYCWSKTESNKPEIIRPLSNLPYLLHLTPATVIRMKKIIKLSVTSESLFNVHIFLSNVLCFNLTFCSLSTFTSLQCMAQFWDSTQEHAFAQNNLLSLRLFWFFFPGWKHLPKLVFRNYNLWAKFRITIPFKIK